MRVIVFVLALFAVGLLADSLAVGENILQIEDMVTQRNSNLEQNVNANQSVNLQSMDSSNTESQHDASVENTTQSDVILSNQQPGITQQQQPINPDDRLRDNIVNFERERHIRNSYNVDDPFLYADSKSEDKAELITQLEQTVLTLKSIVAVPDSKDGAKRYKAHINNHWVEECKAVGQEQDKMCSVSGWKVVSINENGVKLSVSEYNLEKELELASKKAPIKIVEFK